MNSGCFDREFKDVLISIQTIDFFGNIKTIPANKINFTYRGSDLEKENIILSGTFQGTKKNINNIEKYMKVLKEKKDKAQPSRIKTGGSTFKNPKEQTDKKVWQLIKESVPNGINFGDAKISDKHTNFFENKNNANFKDMMKLIDYVKDKVKEKKGIDINLEIVIAE